MASIAKKDPLNEVLGIAAGAAAPVLLKKFAGNLIDQLPAFIQPLLPVGIGLGFIYGLPKNQFAKSVGYGMIAAGVTDLAANQLGIGDLSSLFNNGSDTTVRTLELPATAMTQIAGAPMPTIAGVPMETIAGPGYRKSINLV